MINTDPWTGGTEEEYETQHFGFGAQRLKIALRQMVEQKIKSVVKDMESYLINSLDLNDDDHSTITLACDDLIKLYCERAGPSLDIIDSEIERILKIPRNVLLPEDETKLEDISDVDYDKLKEEVSALQKRVERGALMEALLTAENEELSSLEKVCEAAKADMEMLDILHKGMDARDNLKSIQSATQFLCASVATMKKSNKSTKSCHVKKEEIPLVSSSALYHVENEEIPLASSSNLCHVKKEEIPLASSSNLCHVKKEEISLASSSTLCHVKKEEIPPFI